jgi:small subunit ribosomal protein S33
VLRKRLIGPIVQQYYPRQSASLQDMLKFFKKRFDLVGENEEEEDRLENVAIAKLRGKGAPKKKREKVEKRRFGGKKK